jgi:hypothetical protein
VTDQIIEDDPDDDTKDPELADDAPPQGSDPEVSECPHCDEKFRGIMRKAQLQRHINRRHPEFAKTKEAPKEQKRAPGRPKREPKSDAEPRSPSLTGSLRTVRQNVELFYSMAGAAIQFRDSYCGGAVISVSSNAAAAWVELAKKNEKVLAFWSTAGGATGWLSLAMAHLPIALALQVHHIQPAMERRQAAREAIFVAEPEYAGEDEARVYTTGPSSNGTEPAPFDSGLPSTAVPSIGDQESPFTEGGLE